MALACRKASGARQQCVVLGIAGLFLTLFTNAGAATVGSQTADSADPTVRTCNEGEETVINLSLHENTARFKCGSTVEDLSPSLREPLEGLDAFVDDAGTTQAQFPFPDVAIAEQTKVYTVSARAFPAVGGTWYLFCVAKGTVGAAANATKKCRVQLVIQGTSVIRQQCTTVGGSVDLRILGSGYAVTFGCGLNFPQLDPPLSGKEVYVGRDCSEKQPLTAVVPSAEFDAAPTGQLFTLLVNKLPPSERVLCYKCVNDSTDPCTAVITIPSPSEAVTTPVASTTTTPGPSSGTSAVLQTPTICLLLAFMSLF
uniref:SRS domain-containing protein n=1 Tax=Neospora caninum (strain Liverpool) TaxID=572307 RepID=A0A0F7ULN7_NEOCL|nr:TPA: SRS domain-containing protein [Neospora caninum Liverpool]